MADTQKPQSHSDHDSTGWLILGAVLIVLGLVLSAHAIGLIPWSLSEMLRWGSRASTGIGVLIVGVVVVVMAQSNRRPCLPEAGTKLYRSRHDKWIAGVLGGLAQYFNIDATLLRLLFLALMFTFDWFSFALAYIVLAIIVPLEPKGAVDASVQSSVTPAAPVISAAPVPPAANPAPEAPAAPASAPACGPEQEEPSTSDESSSENA